ncbi:23218_t:CDS:2, partial [Gigaspora margarita]
MNPITSKSKFRKFNFTLYENLTTVRQHFTNIFNAKEYTTKVKLSKKQKLDEFEYDPQIESSKQKHNKDDYQIQEYRKKKQKFDIEN